MSRLCAPAAAALAALTAACSRPDPQPAPSPRPVRPVAAEAAQAAAPPAALNASSINAAPYAPNAWSSPDRSPALVRAQVLLDRAKFSPGVIDGKPGENLRQAVAAFEQAHGMTPDGQLTQAVFDRLTAADTAPVLKNYVITAADVKGPFRPIPHDFKAQSELDHMGYESAGELIAEKFHMTQDLLEQLNPGTDFSRPGQTITVAAAGDDTLPAKVALIEVDKAEKAVKAYDAKGALLAFYPATIGSDERPAPSGVFKVSGVSHDPTYVFDPKRLTFGHPGVKTRTTLPSGPNNPVGLVWVGLSVPTYGIHGTDEPKEVGKRFSHGCVRLTNWDAEELASGVKPGVKVSFIDASPAGLRAEAAKAKPAADKSA
jgi:lipoprotein-anchoring transpeptidase ErfK/SrfK